MKKQIKVAYFPSTSTKNMVLDSNGKSLDRHCIKCEVEEDLTTGNYILDATFLIENKLQDLLQEEVILKVLMDYGEEIFRISKVTVGTRYIDIVARQITIADSLNLWLEDVRPTDMAGSSAAKYLVSNATGAKEIEIVSDVMTISTAYYMRMNLYKALHDTEQSFLNRWGGEVLRRGYIEYINGRIGIDRGFTIREGKNLTGFECNSNIDSLITRAIGQGYDGILGKYIDSPLINNYNRVYTEVIKYEDVKVKDENNKEGYNTLEQAQAELNRRIKEEYSKNGIDKIKASYTINFVQLEKTEEYKDYIVAERVYLGDTIRVYIPKLNTDIKVRAIAKKYDVLAQKTKEIKLSNYIQPKPLSIKQIIDRLDSIDSTDSILQQAKENASILIKSGLKNSNVIVRENEIIIGDTKDINTMTNVWRFNANGLGHSSTGYYGKFGTAITMDGHIVGSFITALEVSANNIKGGFITSTDKTVNISLNDGYAKFNHVDGSYTKIGANGLERYVNGSAKKYKYITYIDRITLRNSTEMNYSMVGTYYGVIPIEYREKNLKGFATIGGFYPFDRITDYGDHRMSNPLTQLSVSNVYINTADWTYYFTYNITGVEKSYWQMEINIIITG
jgi:phage minor structural protein